MRSVLKRLYTMPVFMATLFIFGYLVRIPLLVPFVISSLGAVGRMLFWIWDMKTNTDVSEIAVGWTELMPKPKTRFPVIRIENGIAFGEIHVRCPLRGTGNVLACHRLMEFDRAIVEKLGGELTVTDSQSTSGRNYCSVAIKRRGSEWKDVKTAWPSGESN